MQKLVVDKIHTPPKNFLTKRQDEILRILHDHIQSSGFPPTLAELKNEIGVSSNQAVLDALNLLELKRMIKRIEGSARAIKILTAGFKQLGVKSVVPVVGESSCGAFVEALEQVDSWQTVSGDLEQLDHVYFVRVRGDSMINAGIEDGDSVLVKDTREFKSGNIVLAETLDGTTIKRLIVQNKSPHKYLKPENPKYDIIIYTKDMSLRATALKVFKKTGEIINLI